MVFLATNEGILIEFNDENPEPYIGKFRPIEINILVDNLFSNSKKAGATEFKVGIKRQNNNVVISFSDNGKGIEENKLKDIFKYGYTTSEGSGIGLFHVKEIIQRIGGKLEIESEVKKGTTIKIIL